LIKVPVVVCALSGTFIGTTCHIVDQRPLDALYGRFVAKALRMGKDFMPLTDVGIHPALPGGASAFDLVAVDKDHVAYVTESPK
jgi:hypothetical protein